jgi:HD-like signal output (HDOD) protein
MDLEGDFTAENKSSLASPRASDKQRVLFVGNNPLWFGQVQRDVSCLQTGWACLYVSNVPAAFRVLATDRIDSLVVDGEIFDSRRLLDAVKAQWPQMNCLIRCVLSDRTTADSWKGSDVPLLDSQKDASALISSLLRNGCLREWTSDPAIKTLLPKIRKLPATSNLYSEVTQELQNPSGSLDVVARLIQEDPVVSAKLLQLVNSAFFSSVREVTNVLDAIIILGTERVKSLILLAGIFSQYSNSSQFAGALRSILAHSVQVGTFSRIITLSETQNATTADAAFTAGVLHDVGKLILAGNLPDMFDQLQKLKERENLSDRAAEAQIYGVGHTQVGACLLASWGLPLPILEAIAYHHEPERSSCKTFSLLTAVHAANAFAHAGAPPSPMPEFYVPPDIHLQYLEIIGLSNRRDRWRALCLEAPAHRK